jgi:hypothetical protein
MAYMEISRPSAEAYGRAEAAGSGSDVVGMMPQAAKKHASAHAARVDSFRMRASIANFRAPAHRRMLKKQVSTAM